jgi:uncharacterized protein with von Willebrand factor type A (vWA) domain
VFQLLGVRGINRQQRDLINLLLFFQNKESMLKKIRAVENINEYIQVFSLNDFYFSFVPDEQMNMLFEA